MSHASSFLVRCTVFAVVATVAACAADYDETAHDADREFIALVGDSAAEYQLPEDVRLEVSQYIPSRGLTYERYQQYHEGFSVMGGQFSVYRDAAGEALLVVGAHYDDLAPVNTHLLSRADARDIAVADLRKKGISIEFDAEGKCDGCGFENHTEMCPASKRAFFTIETTTEDSRHLHWINAETGEIIDDFDILTTADTVGLPKTIAHSALTHEWESGSLSESFSALAMVGAWSNMDPSWFDGDMRRFDGAELPVVTGPAHYCDRHTAATDNWGVNINSGIPSQAFIEATNRLDYADAAGAFFDGFNLLPSTATFMDAREATIAAAQARFPADPERVDAVVTAWNDVGVIPGMSCPQ